MLYYLNVKILQTAYGIVRQVFKRYGCNLRCFKFTPIINSKPELRNLVKIFKPGHKTVDTALDICLWVVLKLLLQVAHISVR